MVWSVRAGVPGAVQDGAEKADRVLPQRLRQSGTAALLHGGALAAQGHRPQGVLSHHHHSPTNVTPNHPRNLDQHEALITRYSI